MLQKIFKAGKKLKKRFLTKEIIVKVIIFISSLALLATAILPYVGL